MRKSSIEYGKFKCLVDFRSLYLDIANNQSIKKSYIKLTTKTQKLL